MHQKIEQRIQTAHFLLPYIQQQLAGEIEADQHSQEAEQKRSWFKKLFRR